MAQYFDQFPKMTYDFNRNGRRNNIQLVTDIFFRMAFLNAIKNKAVFYYAYQIKDDETPEVIADNVYNNSEAHWIILMLNDIVDPFYDWPLSYDAFANYLKKKYGSVNEAQITIHHYQKVITRVIRNVADTDTVTRKWYHEVDYTDFRDANTDPTFALTYPTIPWDTYTALPVSALEFIDADSGRTVEVTTTTEAVTNYDYEWALNDKRRRIKLLHRESYEQVMQEFGTLLSKYNPVVRSHLKSAKI